MALGNGSYTRTEGRAPDDRKHVVFLSVEVQDEAATMAAGRPICRMEERYEISFPGNQLNIFHGRVTDEIRNQYAREYEAFKKGEEVALDGTPIEQLTVLNRAQIRELKFFDIHTIEDAASLDENAVQRLGMGGHRLRELCRKYLAQAEGLAPLAEMVALKENLESKVAMQAQQLDEMNRIIQGMQAQLTNYASSPQPVREVHSGMVDNTNLGMSVPAASSSLDSIGDEPPRQKRAYTKRKAA